MAAAERVLLVSPDTPEREQLQTALTDHDLNVDTVVPGQVGVLSEGKHGCAVVAVPDEQAAEVVARLEAAAADLSVIVLYETEETATTALMVGATRCLPSREPTPDWVAHLATLVEREIPTPDQPAAVAVDRDDAELLRESINVLPDLFFLFDLSGTFLLWNDRVTEVTGYTDDEIAEMAPTEFFDDVEYIASSIQRVIEEGQAKAEATLVTKAGNRLPYEFTGTLLEIDGETIGICGIGRDVSQQIQREHALEQQADELRRYDRINRLIREVNKSLVQTDTREAIEQTVCETIASAEFVRLAWIGGYDATEDTVEPHAWAGEGSKYLEKRPTGLTEGPSATARTTIETREVQFVSDVTTEEAAETWREAALEHGHKSGVAIPLSYGETVYGCLCVYAPEPDAFARLERTVLKELGETVAYAISASEARRALTAETVTQLEFSFTDSDMFLVQAAQQVSGEVTLNGAVPREDDVVTFLTVRGIDAETVRALAAVSPYDLAVRREDEEELLVEAAVPDPSITRTVIEHGGIVRRVSGGDGDCRLTVELPTGIDVSGVVTDIRNHYDCELLAQRRVDRTAQSGVSVRADIESALTARQREVLETAYMAGYFDWPREADGDEVASLLDVSAPTFHEHARTAQRKLLAALFEETLEADIT